MYKMVYGITYGICHRHIIVIESGDCDYAMHLEKRGKTISIIQFGSDSYNWAL